MKRANGSGSISKAGGRFRVRISHPGRPRESLGSFLTCEEAQSVLNGALALLAEGAACPAGTETLITFERRYFELRALRARDARALRERARYGKHLLAAPFAAKPLAAVSTLDVQRWIDALALTRADDSRGERRLSQESVKKIVRLARSVFKYAIKDGILESNPVTRDLELPAPDERTSELWDYLQPSEQSALLTCDTMAESTRLWLAFAMGTGLRPGELFGLALTDVHDGPAPCVHVRKTKTNRPRVVPLFGLALAAWRRWVAVLPSFCPHNPRDLAWPRPRGARRSGLGLPRPNGHNGAQTFEHQVWRSYLRAAGIERDLRWYDATRHTFATSLLCGFWGPRWTLTDVSKALGHTSTKTTERYAHVADEVLKHAGAATTANALVTLVGRPVGPANTENAARPARLERATNGLEGRVITHYPEQLQAVADQPADSRITPVNVLQAMAAGRAEEAREGGRQLALRALQNPLFRAAMAVLNADEFSDARITELCALLLEPNVGGQSEAV